MKHIRGAALILAGLLIPALASAQATADGTVENDPIRCWWRSTAGAVRLGEPFSVVLTCAVLDTDSVRVVPDESRLSDSVIQMAPFEVIGGTHPADLHSGQRRFFQYEYTLRALGPDLIGRDVPLPNLVIQYRVNSRLPGNAALEGRDMSYLLPPHAVRIVSLVPADAADIRDTPDVRFDRVEALDFRAGVLDIVAVALIALGSIMTIVAVAGLVRRARPAARGAARDLSERTVLAAAARELSGVQSEADRHGWNEGLIARALAATRIAAAPAVGRRASQLAPTGEAAGEGRVIVQRFTRRGSPVAVSSAVTSEDVSRALARLPVDALPARRETLEQLLAALTAFGSVQYGRAAAVDREKLDRAASAAADAARRLRSEYTWPREQLRRWSARTAAPERA